MEKLHAQATRIIKVYKDRGYEAPAAMQAIWDWEHEKMIEHTAKVRALLDHAR